MDMNREDCLNLKYVNNLIKEEQIRLEDDKSRFQRNAKNIKSQECESSQSQLLSNITFPKDKHSKPYNNADVSETSVAKNKTKPYMIRNSREEEINKLIDKISKPKEQTTVTSYRELRRSYPQITGDFNQLLSPIIDVREREKDQLSEKLASTESPLTIPSSRHISKNLCSSISFNDFKQNSLEKVIDKNQNTSFIESDNRFLEGKEYTCEEQEDYLRAKYNHPKIVVSHYSESEKDTVDSKMVRIGEFSPLNPNLPGGATVLGLGDWDEKRQLLLQKYKQVSRSPSPSHCDDGPRLNHRSIATQTDPLDDWSPNISMERSLRCMSQSPEETQYHRESYGRKDVDTHCRPTSPIPKHLENMTEKEIREYMYRQELQKQIEEKNRLKEKMKKKELEEEAKFEAKIQKDIEKMRRQYEEERLHRLELAIRKREQEDVLREKLASEHQKAKESKAMKKRSVKDAELPNYVCKQHEKGTQSDLTKLSRTCSSRKHYSRSLPDQSAASALSTVHQELRQPLLKPETDLLSSLPLVSDRISPPLKTKQSSLSAISPPISVHKSKEVDILAQKAVFNTTPKTSPRANANTPYSSSTARERLKEVDNILKQPLISESRVLPPVSQPLLHATIPPFSASFQSPRINTDILEDKWKVPYVEQGSSHMVTKHNAHILTQLGTFRRQLHEESLRMRQRVKEDSP